MTWKGLFSLDRQKVSVCREIGFVSGLALGLGNQAEVLLTMGRIREALVCTEQILQDRTAIPHDWDPAASPGHHPAYRQERKVMEHVRFPKIPSCLTQNYPNLFHPTLPDARISRNKKVAPSQDSPAFRKVLDPLTISVLRMSAWKQRNSCAFTRISILSTSGIVQLLSNKMSSNGQLRSHKKAC